jgi:hypothetical protein
MKELKYYFLQAWFRLKEQTPPFFKKLFYFMLGVGFVGFGLMLFRQMYPSDFPKTIPGDLPGYMFAIGIVGSVCLKLPTDNPLLKIPDPEKAVKAYKAAKKKEENSEVPK